MGVGGLHAAVAPFENFDNGAVVGAHGGGRVVGGEAKLTQIGNVGGDEFGEGCFLAGDRFVGGDDERAHACGSLVAVCGAAIECVRQDGEASRVRQAARPMNRSELLILLALSVLWGSSFFFYKVLGVALPPLTVALGRVALAAAMLNLVLAARRQSLGRRAPWGRLLVLGVLNSAVPFTLFAWAEMRISSGMAAMLNATTPLFAVLLAHVLSRTERLTWARGAGVALGMAGVAVLVGPAAWQAGGAGRLWGDAACVAASLSYALAGQFNRTLRGLAPLQVAAGQLTTGAVVLLPVAALCDRFWTLPAPAASVWAALLGMALLCTALAYMLFFRLMATAGAVNAMLVTFLLPITALLLGWAVLGEPVPARAVFGMILVGAGLLAIDGRLGARVSALETKRDTLVR